MTKDLLKIFFKDKDYVIEIELSENILHFEMIDVSTSEKYKNNYTYMKLVNKVEALSYITNSIDEIKKEVIDLIKKSQYDFEVFDFFALFNLHFIKFPNDKKNFSLELFLYKTDSRQATLMINQLEDKVNFTKKSNEDLKESNNLLKAEIEAISQENSKIKSKIESINNEILGKIVLGTEQVNITNKNRCQSISEKIDKTRMILRGSLISNRRSTAVDVKQLPILRPEDMTFLVSLLNLNFQTYKLYDSSLDGDSMDAIKQLTCNKLQTLTLIETENGRRFGAYISLPFFFSTNTETYLTDDASAFIFSIDKKRKFKITNLKYVVSFNKEGIMFGLGPDIFISEGFTTNNKNYSQIQGSFGEGEQLEEGYSRSNYLTGQEYFKIRKVEISQVIFK